MNTTGAPFVPPFCPRSDCRYHRSAVGWTWQRFGFFSRRNSPHRVRRFRCVHCAHTFSEQTFSLTYYLKRPDVLLPMAQGLIACSGYRQLCRSLKCSPTTIQNQSRRLGRHALLALALGAPKALIAEPLVTDGFESFAYSQYHPHYLNLVVGAESHFVYGFTFSQLRRKGRMTTGQRRRRARIEAEDGRPDPRAIERGTYEALRMAAREPQALVVRSDEHKAYPRALQRLQAERYDITHEWTSSKEARTAGNPLFPVNRMDLLLRHNLAAHKRETIAFAKRNQAVIERAAWLFLWLNECKPFSERHGGGTPAMRAGLRERPRGITELLRWRLFPERIELPKEWRRYYRGDVPMPRIKNERRHRLKLAA